MNPVRTSVFDLPAHLAAKADPALISADEQHFAAIEAGLERSITDLTDRLEEARRAPARHGQQALDRDQEVHRLTAGLRTLRRFGLDLCLGRMVPADDPEHPVYVGRLGLKDADGRQLLVDWRSPVAEPFFGATHGNPMGLASRRRYRWTNGRITDYWDEAFTSADPGTPHNDARDDVWNALLDLLVDKLDDPDVPPEQFRQALARNPDLAEAFDRAWPMVDATDLVGDLWTVPAYLRLCAPWLSPDEVRLLQRGHPHAWTVEDLPLLDAARRRLGDPEGARLRRRRAAALVAEREVRSQVVEHLVATDDTEMQVMSMLRVHDLEEALMDEAGLLAAEGDPLAGPFAHVVVDEAQELTDAEWQMLLQRCPSRSLTVVGDRAQARHGFRESWQERLARVGLERVELASLTVNYRTPEEVMAVAEPVIRAALPDANVPISIRSGGVPVTYGSVADLDAVVDTWLEEHPDGVACVIGTPSYPSRPRVRSLTPELAKGLEFDLVVLVEPDAFGDGIEGAVDRYVAMTRATERLVVLR